MTKTYPDQRYTNEHLVQKLLHLKATMEDRLAKAHASDKWKIKREWIVSQIIWMREGGVIKNDIYRDFGLL